ncbi:hypothetical protein PV325_007532, partial [Microctonus aethiopoides]
QCGEWIKDKKNLGRKSTGAIERMSSIETEQSGTRTRKTIEEWKTKRHGEVDTNVSSRTTASPYCAFA